MFKNDLPPDEAGERHLRYWGNTIYQKHVAMVQLHADLSKDVSNAHISIDIRTCFELPTIQCLHQTDMRSMNRNPAEGYSVGLDKLKCPQPGCESNNTFGRRQQEVYEKIQTWLAKTLLPQNPIDSDDLSPAKQTSIVRVLRFLAAEEAEPCEEAEDCACAWHPLRHARPVPSGRRAHMITLKSNNTEFTKFNLAFNFELVR